MHSTPPCVEFCSGCLSLLDVSYLIHSAGVTIEWFKTWALGSDKWGFKFQPCLANFSNLKSLSLLTWQNGDDHTSLPWLLNQRMYKKWLFQSLAKSSQQKHSLTFQGSALTPLLSLFPCSSLTDVHGSPPFGHFPIWEPQHFIPRWWDSIPRCQPFFCDFLSLIAQSSIFKPPNLSCTNISGEGQKKTEIRRLFLAFWIKKSSLLGQQSPNFLAPGTSFAEDIFSIDWGGAGGGWWFQDVSSTLHLLCILSIVITSAIPQIIRH